MAALAAVLLIAAGCGLRSPGSDGPGIRTVSPQRQQALLRFDTWDMRARAAIKRRAEAYNIGLHWKQAGREIDMLLEAPFGQGVFLIDGAAGQGYRLRLPDGGGFANSTPEALLEDAIGWSLPISGLEYWIRGLPRPGAEFRIRPDDAGRTRSIDQDSWEIRIVDYFDSGPEPALPRRLNLSQGEIRIKIVIEHWQKPQIAPQDSDLFPEFD